MGEITRRTLVGGFVAAGVTSSLLWARRRLLAAPLQHARVVPFRARPALDGRGATVHRLFPQAQLRHVDPFVLLDDFHVAKPAGFPDHPHRGFEAFTYMIDGAFHHKDNLGNDSIIEAGGTQRFTSGRGARHSEMPASDKVNTGMQLWVNLPRRLKKMDPEYVGRPASKLPLQRKAGYRVRTVVGDESPVRLRTAVRYLDFDFDEAAELDEQIPAGWLGIAYVLQRRAMIGPATLERRQAAVLGPGRVNILGDEGSRVILVMGKRHNEPIIHRGPFVD